MKHFHPSKCNKYSAQNVLCVFLNEGMLWKRMLNKPLKLVQYCV